MQKLSVREFKDFCGQQQNLRIILDSVNQNWATVRDTMKIKAVFDSVKISFNPNTVYLCSPLGTIRFDRVKYVEMDEPSLLGAVFSVVCGDISTTDNDKSYTIIVA